MYIEGIINEQPGKFLFSIKIHLVNELKTILLIRNDTFKPPKIITDYDKKQSHSVYA